MKRTIWILTVSFGYVVLLKKVAWADFGATAFAISAIGLTVTWGEIALTSALTAASAYSSYRTRRAQKEMQSRQLTNASGGFAASQMYAYSGISTVWDVMGKPIHVVLGTHGTGGMCVQSYTKRIGAIDYWFGLFAISMGEVSDIRTVKLNGESIANFSGASYQIRKGTHDQTSIDWFRDINTQYTQSGKRVLCTTQITYTIAAACDTIRIRFSMPHGYALIFSQQQGDTGVINAAAGYPYAHHQSVVTITSSGMTTVVADPYDYLAGNTASVNFEIEITGPFTAGQTLYFSKPATYGRGLDEDGVALPISAGTETIYDYIEIAHVVETVYGTGDGYTYPDVALLGVCCPATNTLTSEPETTCVCDGVLCTLPGYLDTPTFTKNPAPQLYTCLTNTLWGAGKYYKAENFEEWVTAANHFDVMISDGAGGTEKRMEINFVMDSQYGVRELRELYGKLTGSRIFRIRGKYRWFLDIPQTVPAMLFSDGNYVQGSLSWSSSTADTLYESIAVKIKDELNDYEDRVIEIPFTAGSTEKLPQLTTDLYGITKLSRATHMGIRLLREARLRDGTATLKGMLDSIACEPGNLVNVGDKEQGQISTGNIVGYGDDYLVLPEPVTFEAGSNYDVLVMLKSGAVGTLHVQMTGAAPQNMSGVTSEIVYITTTFSAIGSTPRDHSPYSLGLNTNAKEDYIVHSIKRTGVKDIEVSMVPYADIWSGAESAPVSDIESVVAWSGDRTPAHITGLTLTEQLTTAASGEVISNLLVSFTPPSDSPGWAKARIYINQVYDDQPVVGYQYHADCTGQIIIPNVRTGVTIGIIAQSVSSTGLLSSYADAPAETIIPMGVNMVPVDVTGLTLTQVGETVRIQWSASGDPATRYYEVRRGASWSGSTVIGTVLSTSTELYDNTVSNDTYLYHVCGKNVAGTYSAVPAVDSVVVSGVNVENVVVNQSEEPTWAGDKVNLAVVGGVLISGESDLCLGQSSTAAASSVDGAHYASLAFDGNDTTYWQSGPFYNAGSFTYWIKIELASASAINKMEWLHDDFLETTLTADVYGSNDGGTWTLINAGVLTWGGAGYVDTFTFTNTTAYKYYKVSGAFDTIYSGTRHVNAYRISMYGYTESATYTTVPADLGRVWTGYLMYEIDSDVHADPDSATMGDYYDDDDTWSAGFDASTPTSWADLERSTPPVVEFRTTDDDPDATPTWSEWQAYSYGQYSFRAVQFRITYTLTNATQYVQLKSFKTMVDVDDVIFYIQDLAVSSSGTRITYANYTSTQGVPVVYMSTPKLFTQAKDTGANITIAVESATATAATLRAYDKTDATVDATVDVNGVGY